MINCYKRNQKAFKEYVKNNPHCSKEEWDEYAQGNCLFSANTLMFHFLHDNLIEYLNSRNRNQFEYLKSIFLWLPTKCRNRNNKN